MDGHCGETTAERIHRERQKPHPDSLCAGGVEIGVRACPKCGATLDDHCPYEKPD